MIEVIYRADMARNADPLSVGRRWWDAWTSRAPDHEKRQLLAADLTFRFNSTVELHGVERFLGGETWPVGITATLLAELHSGDRVAHFYEVVNGSARLRVAELFGVRDGRIAEIDFVTDSAAYPEFLRGGASG